MSPTRRIAVRSISLMMVIAATIGCSEAQDGKPPTTPVIGAKVAIIKTIDGKSVSGENDYLDKFVAAATGDEVLKAAVQLPLLRNVDAVQRPSPVQFVRDSLKVTRDSQYPNFVLDLGWTGNDEKAGKQILSAVIESLQAWTDRSFRPSDAATRVLVEESEKLRKQVVQAEEQYANFLKTAPTIVFTGNGSKSLAQKEVDAYAEVVARTRSQTKVSEMNHEELNKLKNKGVDSKLIRLWIRESFPMGFDVKNLTLAEIQESAEIGIKVNRERLKLFEGAYKEAFDNLRAFSQYEIEEERLRLNKVKARQAFEAVVDLLASQSGKPQYIISILREPGLNNPQPAK